MTTKDTKSDDTLYNEIVRRADTLKSGERIDVEVGAGKITVRPIRSGGSGSSPVEIELHEVSEEKLVDAVRGAK